MRVKETSILVYVDSARRRRFEIEEKPDLGYYLFVYDLETGRCTTDYLQDTLDDVMEQAREEFGISRRDWRETKR